jgi:hypothetical protein
LDWPRVNVYDNEGYLVDSTTLPKELVEACNEAVFRELTDPFSLTPDFVPAQEKIIEERVGPIMTRYSDKGPLDPIPRITVIEQLLSSLIGGSNIRQLVRY